MSSFYELYRESSIGFALADSLDELITNGSISPQLARNMLLQFDKSVSEALRKEVKSTATVKGRIHINRLVEDVRIFEIQNATFKMDGSQTINVPRIRIVSCTHVE
ncbi:hypothetical protein DL93DRAFT_2076609 [Clavulina sp. PMI_390]|nr:hypothetical protein DL93DRAFT_2076609 [Clavulina sp. PMI_390]